MDSPHPSRLETDYFLEDAGKVKLSRYEILDQIDMVPRIVEWATVISASSQWWADSSYQPQLSVMSFCVSFRWPTLFSLLISAISFLLAQSGCSQITAMIESRLVATGRNVESSKSVFFLLFFFNVSIRN